MTLLAQPAPPEAPQAPKRSLTERIAIRVLYGWLHSGLLAALAGLGLDAVYVSCTNDQHEAAVLQAAAMGCHSPPA